MDTARRQLTGLAQLPAHGRKQATKKQGDGAMPQRIAASRPGMDGWLFALWQFGNVIHRVIGTRKISRVTTTHLSWTLPEIDRRQSRSGSTQFS
jgi:hypothetical protein